MYTTYKATSGREITTERFLRAVPDIPPPSCQLEASQPPEARPEPPTTMGSVAYHLKSHRYRTGGLRASCNCNCSNQPLPLLSHLRRRLAGMTGRILKQAKAESPIFCIGTCDSLCCTRWHVRRISKGVCGCVGVGVWVCGCVGVWVCVEA